MRTTYTEKLEEHIEVWHGLKVTDTLSPSLLWPLHAIKQSIRYHQLKRKLIALCKSLYKDPKLTSLTHERMITLISLWLNLDAQSIDQSVNQEYIETSQAFIERARAKWPKMDDTSIFQALRNVWIMNAIQMMAGLPFELTDSMFAYSMLYPLTDNLIDAPDKSIQDKKNFVIRLGLRLRGEHVVAMNSHESDVYEMIQLIEAQYPRDQWSEVWESILLIHEAQLESLEQQNKKIPLNKLTRLTFNKGAASVLADGYLVLGGLTLEQLDFLMAYGIVLQLADDLQDMSEDAQQHHATLFSQASSTDQRLNNVLKLIQFSTITLDKLTSPDPQRAIQLKGLLGSSMRLLIGDALYAQKKHFSKAILGYIDSMQVVRLYQHAKLKAIGAHWMDRLKSRTTA